MAHIKIKNTVKYTTNQGVQEIENSVLCINTMNWNKGQDIFQVSDLLYISEEFSDGNSIQLFQLPTSIDTGEFNTIQVPVSGSIDEFIEEQIPIMKELPMLNHITIDRHLVLKYLNPLLIKTLNEHGYECEDLILINTPWAEIDDNENEIDLDVRKTRIFLTWEQSTYFAENYTDLLSYINQAGIPKVTDLHGKWLYFEWLDDPTGEGTPMEDLLRYVIGAYIEKR